MTEYSAADHEYMARALRLAERGLYTTHPNPRVGCVLVRDGKIVGEGWHQRAGQPHAEPLALRQAGDRARGAAAYVTLEPCSHHGKTPPCSDALIRAGVTRVVAAMTDPNPQVAGAGLARLAAAGIVVESGLMESQAAALNPGFVKRMTRKLPWVRCKLAMSLDGRTAMASGESVWITGEDARRDVQLLRARSSAVVTGSGTVLADNPSMNVRLAGNDLGVEDGEGVLQPLRVILDSQLRTAVDAKILAVSGPVAIFCADGALAKRHALQQAGAEVIPVASTDRGLDLQQVFVELAARDINEVLIEAGPTLSGAALRAGLLDEIVVYMAPHLMGSAARGLFHLPGVDRMADRIDLEIIDLRRVGRDIRITARPALP